MTKGKAYYQAFLILEHLPKDEYGLIPQEIINEIEDKMEYDENIFIDASVELEKQEIDSKTYAILDKVIKSIEKKHGRASIKKASPKEENKKKNNTKNELEEYLNKCKKENESLNMQIDNMKLTQLVEALQNENYKINDAKELILGYRNVAKIKDDEIKNLTLQIKKLKNKNEELNNLLNRIPQFIRKIFIKE